MLLEACWGTVSVVYFVHVAEEGRLSHFRESQTIPAFFILCGELHCFSLTVSHL